MMARDRRMGHGKRAQPKSVLEYRHQKLAIIEAEIQQALTAPDEIRRSSHDPNVLLFYLILKQKRWVVAVVRRLNGDGFLITAYQTDAIKEGETRWRK